MRIFIRPLAWALIFMVSVSLSAIGQETEVRTDCFEALSEVFKTLPRDEVNELIKIQGEITLNRLSWAYLKKSQESGKLEKIETTILQLLDEKYAREDEAFIKAREAFESKPLSRESLARISPYLSDILKAQNKDQKNTEDDPFLLNISDIKLLDILSQFETSPSMSANKSSAASILNYAKLVNSSFSGVAVEEIPENLEFIEDHLQDLNKDLIQILDDVPAPAACVEILKSDAEEVQCEAQDQSIADLFKQSDDIQAILFDMIQKEFLSDHKLYYGLKYGEIWQGVKKKKKPVQHKSGSAPVKKSGTNKTGTKKSTFKPFQLIDDPLHVIVGDKKGRTAESWSKFDKGYLDSFAKSIYENEKVFVHNGDIFDRATGKGYNSAGLKKIYPQLENLLKGKSKADQAIILEAFANGRKSYLLGDTLYDKNGKKLDPLSIIVENRKNELKINRTPADYKGMSRPYLLAMANAIMNKKPTFSVGNKYYDTVTGRDKLSPFLSTKKFENYDSYESEKRKSFKLSQTDLIRKYHLDHASKMKCDKYAVIDKNTAVLQIYKNDGSKVYSSEVLIGAVRSDKKTKFLNYDLKTSNRSTGAGIYTLGVIKNRNPYYTENYGGNLYTLNDENGVEERVMAIHQVPTNLKSRNLLFNDGDPSNNRTTGGCINLKKSDFEKMSQFMGPGCNIYVLPEEAGNSIILKNDKLSLVTDNKISSFKEYQSYNFSKKDSKFRPIKVDVNPSLYQDYGKAILKKRITDPKPFVTGFTRAIEDEKKTIMALYNLDNDEYNEISKLAFGIMGQESAFGTHLKLWTKENSQGIISGLKCAKASLKNWEKLKFKTECKDKNSRGLTQIKQIPDKIKEKYPTVNEKTLVKPRESAIATVGFLAEVLVELKGIVAANKASGSGVQVSRADLMDYMIYLYNGSRYKLKTDDKSKQATPEENIYFKNTKKYSSYITIREFR